MRRAGAFTGDTTNLTLYLSLAAISLILQLIIIFIKRRKKDDEEDDQEYDR